jgi:hypothetical protein
VFSRATPQWCFRDLALIGVPCPRGAGGTRGNLLRLLDACFSMFRPRILAHAGTKLVVPSPNRNRYLLPWRWDKSNDVVHLSARLTSPLTEVSECLSRWVVSMMKDLESSRSSRCMIGCS